ncbi:MAG: hypothetical protein HW405_611 [Candidatus Berkelbacteria bacterium]|nr:hypothetical protein [Candidatus Berkelbacteria bacterium]
MKGIDEETSFIFIAIIGAVLLKILILRLSLPEDIWISAKGGSALGGKDSNGNWVKHGNPSTTLGTSPSAPSASDYVPFGIYSLGF